MDTLIGQLRAELGISEEEAISIIKAITEYVENQHPLLREITEEIRDRELEKIKNV